MGRWIVINRKRSTAKMACQEFTEWQLWGKFPRECKTAQNLHRSKQRKAGVAIYNASLINSKVLRIATPYNLVGVTGFEPAASWSQTKRSTKLSHTPIYLILSITAQAELCSACNLMAAVTAGAERGI